MASFRSMASDLAAQNVAARKLRVETFKSELAPLRLNLTPQQFDEFVNKTVDAGYYHVKDVLRFTESEWVHKVFLTHALARDVMHGFIPYW